MPLPAETLNSKLASLPEGVTVERDRIEVRFSGAKNATERLYALAYALVTTTNGSRRSSTGEPAGGGGDGMTTEALTGRLREGAKSYANWHCPSRPDAPNGGPA